MLLLNGMPFQVVIAGRVPGGLARLAFGAALAVSATSLGGACRGHAEGRPPTTDLSAQQHRDMAAREHAASATHSAQWQPQASRPTPFRNPIDSTDPMMFTAEVYNPTDWHLQAAEKHHRHAQQHEAAARALEKFEEQECRSFPPATRAACPFLGPAVAVRDIEGGVSVHMADGVRVDAVVAHMKCHAAYARARGYPPEATCPIYMNGLTIRQGANAAEIELTVGDKARVAELRQRARDEIIPAGGVSLR